jgi:hypothetical protein
MDREAPGSIAETLLRQLPLSPDAYPQNIDFARESVLVVLFDANSYRAASFLDDRVLGLGTKGAWLPLSRVAEASRQVRNARPVHFIFHTGHVGSTLLSRLLDEGFAVLSLREPLPLRTLATAHDSLGRDDSPLGRTGFDDALASFMRLWSRGYPDTHSVVVKATSAAGRLAAPILAASVGSRAVYLNLRAEPYLATLLAGENSPIDLRGHGPERIQRLRSYGAERLPPLHELSHGELAAMSWLCESCTQREAVERFPDRVMTLDFDDFLADVGGSMLRVLGHFALPHDARTASAMEASPALMRYSKAPEYPYTPSVRAEVLRDSRRDNREEIRKGMVWLEARARSDVALARLVAETGL